MRVHVVFMRFSPFLLSGAVVGLFAVGAQLYFQNRAIAQLSVNSPEGVRSVLQNLPAPPSAGARPTPQPTPIPVWKPRFLGQKVIRVGLSTAGSEIRVYFPDGATLWENRVLLAKIEAGETATLAFRPDDARSIVVQTTANQILRCRRPYFAVNGDPARVTTNGKSARYGRPYRGDLEIFPQKQPETLQRKGPLSLVNVVPLEAYLKGVVPWEMSPSAPLEALKAQAICARTKTLDFVQSKRFAANDFDVCDYDACQGYPGTENEKPTTSQAVEATKGLALYQNGRPIDAVYSTNSGGITANARDVWKGTTPVTYLQSVPDFPANSPLAALWKDGMTEAEWAQFCAQPWPSYARPDGVASNRYEARKYRWNHEVTVEEATKAFVADGISRVMNIQVAERSPSGRIKRIRVTGVDAVRWNAMPAPGPDSTTDPLGGSIVEAVIPTKTVDLEGDGKIRAMFSKRLGSTTALPSSLFTISPQTDASGAVSGWNLQGAGWGHGVGMCQRGAQNHALEGWDARKILNWYYRGVEIRKIN